jgi:hypothetical protein
MAGATVAAAATAPAKASAAITMAGATVAAAATAPAKADAAITMAGATVAASVVNLSEITWADFAVKSQRATIFALLAAPQTRFKATMRKSTAFHVAAR